MFSLVVVCLLLFSPVLCSMFIMEDYGGHEFNDGGGQ